MQEKSKIYEHEPECIGGLIDKDPQYTNGCGACEIISYLRNLNESAFFADISGIFKCTLEEVKKSLGKRTMAKYPERAEEISLRARKLILLIGKLSSTGIIIHRVAMHPKSRMKDGPCCPSAEKFN